MELGGVLLRSIRRACGRPTIRWSGWAWRAAVPPWERLSWPWCWWTPGPGPTRRTPISCGRPRRRRPRHPGAHQGRFDRGGCRGSPRRESPAPWCPSAPRPARGWTRWPDAVSKLFPQGAEETDMLQTPVRGGGAGRALEAGRPPAPPCWAVCPPTQCSPTWKPPWRLWASLPAAPSVRM